MDSAAGDSWDASAPRVVSRRGLRRILPSAVPLLSLAAALLFVQFGCVALCSAAIELYGNHPGNTVDYEAVTEMSLTDPTPLFGAPTVSADSIDFNPVLFNALSQFGSAPDDTVGVLSFFVQAHPGKAILTLDLFEGGVTTVVGVGTDGTYTDVSATGIVNILAVDGVTLGTSIGVPIDLVFSHRPDGTWKLGSDGETLALPPWTGSQSISLSQALIDNSVPFSLGATRISLELENALYAQSESGTVAFIDKKDFGGLSITVNRPPGSTPVPEPASFLAFLLVALAPWLARRFGS
jgi:hypothetical protein